MKRIGDELLVVMSDGTSFSTGVVRGEAGPAGPTGATGPRGEPGRDGQEVDLDMLDALVTEKIAAAPVPEDMLARMVDDAVATIPRPRDGERGEKGDPGKDADPDQVAMLVSETVERAVAAIPPPRDGADGRDGQDVDPAMVTTLVAERVAEEVAALPPPERGEKGDIGPAGPAGRDGVGMAGSLIDRDGQLVTTMSDGSIRSLGVVVGRDGAQGPPGKDGLDGVGFDDLEVIDGEREAKLRFVRGDNVKEYPLRKDGFWDRGVYKAGETYLRGDAVSFGGSLWIAQCDTTEKPGNGNDSWRMAVKHGRDGRDGTDGEKGERGAEGRPGKDFTPGGIR